MTLFLLASPCHADTPHLGTTRIYTGMCDASAAISLSDSLFVVADDEENTLRTYSLLSPGKPVTIAPLLSDDLEKKEKKKKRKKSAEIDIESATRIDDTILWLGSHGRNAEGKEDLNRQKIVTSHISGTTITPLGEPSSTLLESLTKLPHLNLGRAATIAPKEPGGLNIEGFTILRNGRGYLGFRNPLYSKKALVLPLENPSEVALSKTPSLGTPIFLDLDGRGIKDFATVGTTVFIAAGAPRSSKRSALYRWDNVIENKSPSLILDLESTGINAEGIIPLNNAKLLLLSDDGNEEVDGVPCKKLRDSNLKQFRTIEVSLK